ncbi:MAG: ATP-binding protein [Candidatus Protistobacter heckmanni]|nr:ATP-binding protein [Candidatus Protistobacter heckmanni]
MIALRTGEPVSGMVIGVILGNGDLRWIRVNAEPIRGEEGGKPEMVTATFLDITEQRKNEERLADSNSELEMRVAQRTQALQRANEDLETFVYTLAHDLRAPTRHVAGFSAQLVKMLDDEVEPRARRWLQLIQDSAERQARLVEELLAYTGLGAQPVRSEHIDMVELANAVKEQVSAEWPSLPNIEWVIGDMPPLTTDPVILREVLYNLCANAVKFSQTRETPRVEIGVIRQAEGGPIYFVADNGVGFDPALESHLFKLFERLHPDQIFTGTGMGLAIAKRLLAKIGGSIWAWGRVDEGATFYFNFDLNFDPSVENFESLENGNA